MMRIRRPSEMENIVKFISENPVIVFSIMALAVIGAYLSFQDY